MTSGFGVFLFGGNSFGHAIRMKISARHRVTMLAIVTLVFTFVDDAIAQQVRDHRDNHPQIRDHRGERANEDVPLRLTESVLKDCAECPEMVVLPGGTFQMGSPVGEAGRGDNEGPVHEVEVAPFALGKYEVTFGEWSACVEAGRCLQEPDDEGWGRGRRPVMNVSWEDAREYVVWLSGRTGETYRLPSEPEWEYAARAGTRTRFFWGDDEASACLYANGYDAIGKEAHDFDEEALPCGDGATSTASVGSYKPNGFGLYDTAGNVWEWVEDGDHGSYEGAPTDGSAWVEGGSSGRVVRGGSWNYGPMYLRSGTRAGDNLDIRIYDLGFRVARELTP